MKEGKREALSDTLIRCFCQTHLPRSAAFDVVVFVIWVFLSFFLLSVSLSLFLSPFECYYVCLSASADLWHVFRSCVTPIKPCNNENLNCEKHGWLTTAEIWCAIKKPETIVSALNNIGGSSELKRISVVFTVAVEFWRWEWNCHSSEEGYWGVRLRIGVEIGKVIVHVQGHATCGYKGLQAGYFIISEILGHLSQHKCCFSKLKK